MSSHTVLIESVVENKKDRVVVSGNVLDDETVRYIGIYGSHLGAETDDVIYIFDKCYDTLYINNRGIRTPQWVLDLCTPVKKCGQKKKKKGGKRK